MTSKEALKKVKRAFYKLADYTSTKESELLETYGLDEPLKVIQKLVERDTPKKVEIGTSKHFKIPICPNCKTELNEYYKNKYCKDCGQRLDWSE